MSEARLRTEYEAAVSELAKTAAARLGAGMTEEEVARWAVLERNAIKQAYRERTPAPVLARIVARTQARYGHALGPSADDLRAAGKTWQQIIASATRVGEHGEAFFQGR